MRKNCFLFSVENEMKKESEREENEQEKKKELFVVVICKMGSNLRKAK